MAKMAEATSHETYRDRARQEYEERRAEGRLGPLQHTCAALDEKSGKTVDNRSFTAIQSDKLTQGLFSLIFSG